MLNIASNCRTDKSSPTHTHTHTVHFGSALPFRLLPVRDDIFLFVIVEYSWSKAGLNEQQLVQFVHRLKAKRLGGNDVDQHNQMHQPGFLQAMPNVMMGHHHMYNQRVGL
jgi:hypothetical protein